MHPSFSHTGQMYREITSVSHQNTVTHTNTHEEDKMLDTDFGLFQICVKLEDRGHTVAQRHNHTHTHTK